LLKSAGALLSASAFSPNFSLAQFPCDTAAVTPYLSDLIARSGEGCIALSKQ